MRKEVVDPFVVRITYTYCNDPNCKHCARKQKTLKWLSENFNQNNFQEIPPIVLVQDPETKELLVYDGNIRVLFARENGFSLNAIILTSQTDLNEYLSRNLPLWFRIRNFNEILEYMRIYAQYPDPTGEMPPHLKAKVEKKYQEYLAELEWERSKFYRWYDDD